MCIDLTKLESREILNLLLPSDEIGLQPLFMYIRETLIENHYDLLLKILLKLLN